jgi:hypothetical protein
MSGVGIGELMVISAICCVLGGGVAAIAGAVFLLTRKKSD